MVASTKRQIGATSPSGQLEKGGGGIKSWVISDRLAFAVMRPSTMKRLLFTSTYKTADPESPAPKNHGYQRQPMEERFPAIGRYYHGRPELITPLIVSVRLSDRDDIAEFEALLNAGNLTGIKEKWVNMRVSVVDGQHRKGGLIWAHDHARELFEEVEGKEGEGFDPLTPVMLYFGLSYDQEAALFDTINSTQRKLPKALIEVTKGDITERDENTHAQVIREITFALARDEDSVWFDQVNMTGARDRDKKVTYEGLRRSTANMFPAELTSRIKSRSGADGPTALAKKYWKMVSEACQAAWDDRKRPAKDENGNPTEEPVEYRVRDLVGVAALARLGKDILTSAMEADQLGRRAEDTMVNYISKLSEVDWEKSDDNPWMRSQAGFAGQKDLYTVLYDLVYNDKRPGEPGAA